MSASMVEERPAVGVPVEVAELAPVVREPERDEDRRPRELRGGGIKLAARRAFYQAWSRLPGWTQQLAVRLAARKVTLGACALIIDSRGRLLAAHHTYRQRAWGLPGGFTKCGEEPADGLARELREELDVAALVGPLIYAETESGGSHLTLYYRVTLLGVPRVDGVEIDGVRFVAPDALPALFGGDAAPTLAWLDALRTHRAS